VIRLSRLARQSDDSARQSAAVSLLPGGKRLLDLLQRYPGALRHLDDRNVAEHHGRETPLIAGIAVTDDQPLGFVEVNGRYRDTRSPSDFAHRQCARRIDGFFSHDA
jgi:hypothetical protein